MLQRGARLPPAQDPDNTPDTKPPGPAPAGLPDVPGEDVPVDDGPRERLMSLGFALLFISLGVCLYTMYRLGFCCNRREYNRGRLRNDIPSVNSRLHLISSTDLPPTYDAIMLSPSRPGDLQPPPYFTIITFQDDKVTPPSRPAGAHAAAFSGAAGASSRPQEAG
ncbi:uncharacterized protein LOC113203295 [Frankliniella occidentalis]|uniref:Uncharacterized protein LOC113203295 n=1 Tax=Frankliniella occidentalis TaxID=133901 RepID=A0A9C6TYS3_FRAOC|nr:uncharacterized protein LOC113203295 [Frankliniella occidentalis]